MTFGSVCSGIEAASVAWKPLGWRCAFLSEIDPFCCALLKHYYPEVPNYGDMLKSNEWPTQPIDVLAGGTPCQSFSVAGLRGGLADPRGNLTLSFLAVAARFRPRWLVWENVAGILSDDGRAFDQFLDGLTQCGYGWTWRVLDAQYFGLAQRRQRVFVVGHSGGAWQRAAAVLFDGPSLRGNPAPRREKRERIAPTVEGRSPRSSGSDFETSGGLVETSPTISARNRGGGGLGTDAECDGALVAFNVQSFNSCAMTGKGRAQAANETEISRALDSAGFTVNQGGTLIAGTLSAANGKQRGAGIQPESIVATIDASYGRLQGASGQDAQHGHSHLIAFTQNQCGDVLSGEVMAAVGTNQNATGRNTPKVQSGMAVRRLLPVEVERLFGFEDNYTLVPYRGKLACDGPRYRALGNSMAVPVVRWIGQRIEMVDQLDCGVMQSPQNARA